MKELTAWNSWPVCTRCSGLSSRARMPHLSHLLCRVASVTHPIGWDDVQGCLLLWSTGRDADPFRRECQERTTCLRYRNFLERIDMGLIHFGLPPTFARWLRDEFRLQCLVETGTNEGGTAAWASGEFERVIT